MKKFRFIACLLVAALAAASFAGCGNSAAKAGEDAAPAQQNDEARQSPQNESGVMAKVVSLDGDRLTVILADMPGGMPKGGGEEGAPPDNITPPAINGSAPPEGNTPPGGAEPRKGGGGPAPASGSAVDSSDSASGPAIGGSDSPADGQNRPGQPGQGGGEIKFTGERVTYTLSDDVTVMKGMDDDAEGIDLSELAADDVISFSTVADEDGNEVIDSIRIIE